MKTIIVNIAEIIQIEDTPKELVRGADMSKINTLKDAYLEIENDLITSFGSMTDFNTSNNIHENIIDANNGMIFPAFCDSHTHLVFSHYREEEFVDRINGLTYEEIHKRGGGILNSAKKLQKTSEETLYKQALKKIDKAINLGTGAIEIKSGYGLNFEAEIKMLRVIKKLKDNSSIKIKSTFLGAHAIPQEHKKNKAKYIDIIIEQMLPLIAKEKLADYIDVFCEKNYYSVDDTVKIIKAASKYNIQAKTHVNQFNSIGGVKTSVELGALSVDHLEQMEYNDFEILKNSDCMPTILPTCSFFLGIPYGPAKRMIDEGLPVALASDFNPGSSPSGNMNFVSSLGCIKMKMTPEEVINATTINTAYAIGLEKELGSICVGKKANFFITKNIPSYAYVSYCFGENCIEKVILNGKII